MSEASDEDPELGLLSSEDDAENGDTAKGGNEDVRVCASI